MIDILRASYTGKSPNCSGLLQPDFYARGLIRATVTTRELDDINTIFDEMKHGKIDGRVVIRY